MLHWNLLAGAFPVIILVLGSAAGLYLLAQRHWPRWWTLIVPLVIVGAAGLAMLVDWYVNDIWHAFTDPLPNTVVICFAVIFAAIALLVLALIRRGWRRRVVAVLATALIIAASLNVINQYYGYYPTVADALGKTAIRQIPLPPVKLQHGGGPEAGGTTQATVTAGPSGPDPATTRAGRPPATLMNWRPRGSMPKTGALSEVTIPATVSKFWPRSAYVYLPPAYLTANRPDLPVLMLLPGQLSSARTWFVAGDVVGTMNAFAADHHGIAPVVVLPDPLGTATGKQMCLDSQLGHVLTYLDVDVPDWIRTHLQVDEQTAHWAVGGFSYGGTCALELAVARPKLFPTFLDISGEIAPTLGSTALTVRDAFGGDAHAYQKVKPLRILAASLHHPGQTGEWRHVDGTFVVGKDDRSYTAERAVVVEQCRNAGMAVHEFTEPGGHSWYVATNALRQWMPHLAARTHLT